VNILLDADRLPEYSQLLQRIRQAHGQHRGVAIHCVTRTELIFALTALLEAGGHGADRIEHASVTPDAALPLLQRSGATVVTQPGFIFERGDQYRQDVAVMEQPFLYRCQGFLDAGVPLAAGSDAPYGSPDPWLAMRAANQRRSREGCVLGSAEKLTPERALALYTGTATSPGGASRVLEPGAPADMCLLDRPWQQARQRLNRADVLATVRAGLLIYHRDQGKHSQLENR
jgi:predicted amidohydrolase YtcJ